MGENTQVKKKSHKIVIIAVLIGVILIAAVAGVYYCTLPSQTKQKPEVVTNFSDGAWANYNLTTYNEDGTLASQGSMMSYTIAGTYNGLDCWVYVDNDTGTSTNGTIVSEVVTYNLDKSTHTTLHMKEQVFSNGEVTYEAEFNPGDTGFKDYITRIQNMTIVARDKSVIVPAGTFSTTELQGTFNYFVTSETYDLTAWISPDVPQWGVVKYQFFHNGVLAWEYMLESYGS